MTKNSVEQARFAYDPYGRRVEKVAGGATTSYTYDGEDVLREVHGAPTLKYVHGSGIDEPLAREDGSGALTYYHADGLGSIARRTSQAGAVLHEYRYDTWGNVEAGASEPGFSFTGREWDPEVGLAFYRARYYDPRVGRFISEDPIRFGGAVDFYPYVGNNPVVYTDPWGLLKETPIRICRVVPKVGASSPAPPTPGMGPIFGAIAIVLFNPTTAGGPGDEIGEVVCETAPEPKCSAKTEEDRCKQVERDCAMQFDKHNPRTPTVHPLLRQKRFKEWMRYCMVKNGCTPPAF